MKLTGLYGFASQEVRCIFRLLKSSKPLINNLQKPALIHASSDAMGQFLAKKHSVSSLSSFQDAVNSSSECTICASLS